MSVQDVEIGLPPPQTKRYQCRDTEGELWQMTVTIAVRVKTPGGPQVLIALIASSDLVVGTWRFPRH